MVIIFYFAGSVTETEEEIVVTVIVSATGIVNVSVRKIANVTGNVTEIVTAATVTAKKNVGNTEAGHVKKNVTVTANVIGKRDWSTFNVNLLCVV